MRKNLPDINTLRRYISFDINTGRMSYSRKCGTVEPRERERNIFNTQFCGKPAFATANGHGYLEGSIDGRKFAAHRVMWALHYGEWPSQHIDHINGDKTDNRISNLRDVSQRENLRNMKKSAANKSGHTGVFWSRNANKWSAQIRQNGKAIHLGYFSCIEEAINARETASLSAGYHPNHGKR